MADMEGRRGGVDADVCTDTLLGEQPVERLAAAAVKESAPSRILSDNVHSPGHIFDETTLLKYAQHALLCPGSDPARLLLPCRISCYRIALLLCPPFRGPFTTRHRVLSPYAVLADILPWS